MSLDSAFREAIGASGCVRHLVFTVEVEILGIDFSVEAKDIAEAVWSCLREELLSGVEVSLMKRPFRGTRKVFVRMEDLHKEPAVLPLHRQKGEAPGRSYAGDYKVRGFSGGGSE